MAAPSGTVWGSVVGDYGRVGIHVALTHTATTTRRVVTLWFWSKYSVSDSTNTLYYDAGTTSATSSKGSVSISTSVSSGTGWSTSNQVKLKTYDHTYSRGTSNWSESCAMKLAGIDRVGGTMTASTSYTVPKLDSYTVSYNANGGTGAPGAQTKYYGKNITLSTTKPTRTGYTFQGWATSSTGAVAYQPGATYSANAGITLYAKWTAITYAVYYNGNGGTTNIPSTQTKTYGVNLALSSARPTRTGYTFLGWATSSTGAVAYQPGATYSANAAVTLYAKWQLITYSITYDANGGTGAPGAQTKNYGSTLTLSSVKPTRTNYNFLGWSTNKSATSAEYSAGGSYTANAAATLYAVWKLAYTKPRITNISITRCDVDGNPSDSGTYALLSFTYATDLKPRNPLISYMYNGEEQTQMLMIVVVQDPVTGEEIYSTKDTFNNVIVGAVVEGGPFSLETSHTINIILSDGEGGTDNTTIIPVNLPAMKFLIDFKSGGNGVAIGKPAYYADRFDVAWPIMEEGTTLASKYSRKVKLTNTLQNDYCYSVIGLCKTSATNTEIDSYSIGQLIFHRGNGLNAPCLVDIAIHGAYGTADSILVSMTQNGWDSGTVVYPCTFKYNGVTYGGVKVFFADAGLKHVEFNGSSNFDIFALDYYNRNTSLILNTEINSSIKTVDPSNTYYANGKKVLTSGNYSTYALPLSGGTITGTLTVNSHVYDKGHHYFAGGTTYYISNGAAFNLAGGTVNGALNVTGSVTTNNNYGHHVKNTAGTALRGIAMDTSNNFLVGQTGNSTYIYGYSIYLNSGSGRIYFQTALTLNHQMNLGTTKASDGEHYYINNNGTGRFNALRYVTSKAISSRRFKNNIDYKDVDYWHEALMQIKPCTFFYNNDDKTKHIGLIAEDLYELIPELVGLDDEDGSGNTETNVEPLPSAIEYANLTVPLIGEVQRLNKIVEDQQAQIDELKSLVQQLLDK